MTCLPPTHLFRLFCILGGILEITPIALAQPHRLREFAKQQLTGTYYSEGIAVGDINGDGIHDIVYGPYWFEGPSFEKATEIYPAKPQRMEGYADHFFAWVYDFNNDGAADVLTVGFPGTAAYVYENPGNGVGTWTKHRVFDWVSNESPQFVQLVGDDRPELVCTRDGYFGFAEVNWEQPWEMWKFTPISERIAAEKFGHGLGVGDVNGDGRLDIIHKDGWFEQPAGNPSAGRWHYHRVPLSNSYGGADMFVYDVDGDGLNDIITSEAAHDFGLSWYRQSRHGDEVAFEQIPIMGSQASDNKYGILFTEPHSLRLADIDGDGLLDIVTGKTYYSHHQKSPLWDAGAVVYWFRLVRGPEGVDWIPHLIDATTGIGRQVVVADINHDGLPDVATGGMLGGHVLMQRLREVNVEEFEAAQPKPFSDPTARKFPPAQRLRGPHNPIGADGKVSQALEAETLNPQVTGGQTGVQPMQSFTEDRWSDSKHLWWTGAKPGDRLTLELDVLTDIQTVQLVMTCAPDYGIVELRLDGTPLAEPIDLYEPKVVTTGLLEFTTTGLRAGKHQLEIEIVGANPKAIQKFMVGLDFIRFRQPGQEFSTPPVSFQKMTDDEYPFAGLPADNAAAAMLVPEGFQVIACASEPEVRQPIAMAFDDRGRTWIAEAYEYPLRANGDSGRDRILIFEDTSGDGRLDSRKIFYEGLNLVSGIEVGHGGVWVGAAPYLLFIPDANQDDVPDGPPQILLDGWGYEDTHETLNTFSWGPDGWLYGCHGVFTHSRVGKPGTLKEDRIPINAGIWRYHPIRHEFEVFAHGTSNPWGLDFNDLGDAFCTACVIPHLYHIIPEARYVRQAGRHFNRFTYGNIATIADHLHYLGPTPHGGNNKSDAVGGGHAHAGAMIYLGGVWPEEYRGSIFMNNIHGQRLNVDMLNPKGSGYVGSHAPDFLLTRDQASQILNMRYGPDGQVVFIDWYDMQACHRKEVEVHDRSNGRIYKVFYGDLQPVTVDLAKLADIELAEMVLHNNDWYVRHSRRLLQERSVQRDIEPEAIEKLSSLARTHSAVDRRLRALWALHGIRGISKSFCIESLKDPSPHVRAWAIRLLMERHAYQPSDELVNSLVQMARTDESQVVRLALASSANRLPLESRWNLLAALTAYPEDRDDHNLPLLIWYAMEPLAELDADRALALGLNAGNNIPILREYMLRRVSESGDTAALDRLMNGLEKADSIEMQLTFLSAMRAAVVGQRKVAPPTGWQRLYQSLEGSHDNRLQREADALGIIFGDAKAIEKVRGRLTNPDGSTQDRLAALDVLLSAADPKLAETLLRIVDDSSQPSELVEGTIRGLAQVDHANSPQILIAGYAKWNEAQRRAAIATLSSRKPGAKALLEAIASGTVPTADLTADYARQIETLGDEQLSQSLATVWGQVRRSPEEKLKQIEHYRQLAERSDLPAPDLPLGRTLFSKTCQRCHVLYGVGREIGPDITGSNRSNLDYVLENIVDPSAVMAKEYRPTIILTDSGQLITGILRAESDSAVTIQTADSMVVVPRQEIDQMNESPQSMMPDDQLSQFSDHEVRSLIAYLRNKNQTPLLATAENASTLFNGSNLIGWSGNMDLWRVENGEIIGSSPGIDRNEFLIGELLVRDFKLSLEVKLANNRGNSGIQFRSQALEGGDVAGYQADIGPGWWGKLYEEHLRGMIWDKGGREYLKPDDWNLYEIEAIGSRIRTWLNGNLCVDLDDPPGSREGIIALQIHSGGPMEVRFRNLLLEVR